jgi:hypothetical protein
VVTGASGPDHADAPPPAALRVTVGTAAIVAPLVHTLTDAMEWWQGGFSAAQLWLNYGAFLVLPWLLLGLYALRARAFGAMGLAGALLHGAAFTYFAHTTLFALALKLPDYATLWQRLGTAYTLHGALMVVGGLLFAFAGLRGAAFPRPALLLFGGGLAANLVLALLPAPELLQTAGTLLRNAGLVLMGWHLVAPRPPAAR